MRERDGDKREVQQYRIIGKQIFVCVCVYVCVCVGVCGCVVCVCVCAYERERETGREYVSQENCVFVCVSLMLSGRSCSPTKLHRWDSITRHDG